MALIWNITFPNGVFSSTDTLIRKSKVKNAYVRETTNLLLVGYELNLKHWHTFEQWDDRKKNRTLEWKVFLLVYSYGFIFGLGGLIPCDFLRKGNAVWIMQCAHDIWATDAHFLEGLL